MLNILNSNYSYYDNKYYKTQMSNTVSFGAKFSLFRKRPAAKDVFVKTIQPTAKKAQHNVIHGTILDGANPLENFFKVIDEKEKETLIKRGMSTNTRGEAYCLLKSSAENPLSSSFAQDCSIIYLYNEQTNTHFLYHIKPF